MFRIAVAGQTIDEVRAKLKDLLGAMSEKNTPYQFSQDVDDFLPQPFSAPPPIPQTPPIPRAEDFAPHWSPEQPHPLPVAEAAQPLTRTDVDSNGLPWDSRIHAISQAKTKDGSWRTRRGVEDSTVRRVEAELRGQSKADAAQAEAPRAQALPTPPPIPAPAPPPVPFLAPPPVLTQPQTIAPPVVNHASPPPAAGPVSIAPQGFAHSLETFKENRVAVLAQLVGAGKLDQPYVQKLKEYFKVEQIWQLNDTQTSEMFDQFCQAGLIARM